MATHMRTLVAALAVLHLLLHTGCGSSGSQPNLQPREPQKPAFTQTGKASFYANVLQGRTMASGDPYQKDSLLAAHDSLPFGTIVKVTNLANNKTVEVEILDRGPVPKERILDLSRAAARKLDFVQEGVIDVRLEVVKEADEAEQGPDQQQDS